MNITFPGNSEHNGDYPANPQQPQNSDLIQSFVSNTLQALGLKPTEELNNGAKVIAGAIIIPQAINAPSWVTPTLSLLGLGIAITPAVKGYFTFPTKPNTPPTTIHSNSIEEPKIPDVSIKLSKSTMSTSLEYVQENTTTNVTPAQSSEDALDKIRLELASILVQIGSTELFQELTREPSDSDSKKLEKIELAKRTIEKALQETTTYINSMGPILQSKSKLKCLIEKTNEDLKFILKNSKIKKTSITKIINDVNNEISALQNSLISLGSDAQVIVPTIDYDKLGLTQTKEFIRKNSLDDRIIGLE
ncbi:MAG: hypothetical protein JSS09_06115, partial [Verrucomicrobia bacterium]|nr:hypothetical protein [Verrucomicrobiota bacterium]